MSDTKPKHPGGRPPIYTDAEVMQRDIDAFFDRCDAEEEPYTITGLAMALNMTRTTLCEYAEKGEFSVTVKKAKCRVENDYEKALRRNGRAGEIFGLKNFGWKDKTETELTGKVSIDTIPDEDLDARIKAIIQTQQG